MSSFDKALESVEKWLEEHPENDSRDLMIEVKQLLIKGKEQSDD